MATVTKYLRSSYPRGSVIPDNVSVSVEYIDKTTEELVRKVTGESAAVDAFAALISAVEVGKPAQLIDPVSFMMLIPTAGRLALRASTDPVAVDFMRMLDDPRLLSIDRNKANVIAAIDYCAALVGLSQAESDTVKTGI